MHWQRGRCLARWFDWRTDRLSLIHIFCDCPLYPASFAPVFAALKPFIARAGLTPYNVARKRGELKYILLTESQSDGGMMLRFVLRSDTKLAQLRKALPWLQEQLPQLKVITVNIQPVHMAIMEGETEIYLTEQQALAERFNDVPLWILSLIHI